MKAMDREPSTLQKAVKYVKTAIANHRALYGTRGTSRAPAYSQSQVSIPSREGSPTRDSSLCRADPKLSNEKDKKSRSLDKQISHLTSLVEKLTTSVQQSLSRNQVRSSSPVPRGLPFEKNRSLSRSPARGQRFPSPTHSKSSNEAKGQPAGDLNKKGSGY